MKFNVFEGKLGKEKFLMEVDTSNAGFNVMPTKGDIVYLPMIDVDENNIHDGETYVVLQTFVDYVHRGYNIFVELYNWEG